MENKVLEIQVNFKSIHPFPARMAPSIALAELTSKRSLKVLDPMAGSGTTIVAARLKGHQAIGFDLDPLAVLISSVWCINMDREKIYSEAQKVLKKSLLIAKKITSKQAYPADADNETKKFINFWFDDKNRKQLSALSKTIEKVKDSEVRSVLWCAFSRFIITKEKGVSLAMDVSHSRPHKVYKQAPIRPFDRFEASVNSILSFAPVRDSVSPAAKIKIGDARKLPLNGNSIDLVVTSPPYLNAIDYLRGHKLALVWMGYTIGDIRKIRSNNVGTEVSLPYAESENDIISIMNKMGKINTLLPRNQKMIARYVKDMDLVISEISRVLKPGGKAVIVIGNSRIKGVYIKNSNAIIALGKKNKLRIEKSISREIPEQRRYLPAPTFSTSGRALKKRMREEVIITFRK